jgi:hypothetical protein
MRRTIRQAFSAQRTRTVMMAVAVVALVSAGGAAAAFVLSDGGPQVSATPIVKLPSGSRHLTHSPGPGGTPPTTPTAPPTTPPPTTPTATVPTPIPPIGGSNLISDTCFYSHEANDDPILDPGRPGQSMAHDFFGNSTTGASSTAASLVGGTTTCSTGADASAYWTPVLSQNGVPITPSRNLIYWAGLQTLNPPVTVPRAGLEMIAGDENAMAPQSTKVVGWRCVGDSTQPFSPAPVSCPGPKGLELRVTFPSCWDGHTLNGAAQTNVVYAGRDAHCPTGYPVRIPTVVFHVIYPITSAAGLTLSMGPGQQGSVDTAHGDFISGWNQSVLTALIDGCAGPAHACGHVGGRDAQGRARAA